MLDKILEKEVMNRKDLSVVRGEKVEELIKEEVSVHRQEGVLMIGTKRGSLSIMPLGSRTYRILYNSLFFEENENWKEVFDGGNKILLDYYERVKNLCRASLNPEIRGGYVHVATFQKDLPFSDALEVSFYILSKIQPNWYNPNKMIN